MENEPLKDYELPIYSQKDMWWAITKTAIAVFVLSGIYFQFVQVKEIQELDHQVMKNRTEAVNERIDKKHGQQEKRIDDLTKVVNTLISKEEK